MTVARGGEPTLLPPRAGVPETTGSLSPLPPDVDLDDPIIRALLAATFDREEMRAELIRAHVADVAEYERRARRRAAIRTLRLAIAAAKDPDDLVELFRKLELEDSSQDSDSPGQSRDSA